jgi:hypothetical protein
LLRACQIVACSSLFAQPTANPRWSWARQCSGMPRHRSLGQLSFGVVSLGRVE